MNFLPIFKYRLKDDLKAVGVFLIVTLLCMVLVIYGIMIMVSEINGRVISNFSIALTVFSFVLGIVTVREDLRLGIQNGVSRGTSLAACFTANVVASLAAALGVTLVEWLSVTTQSTTNAALVSFYAMIYGEDASLAGQLRSFLLSFVWSGSAVFVGFCVERLGGVRGQFPIADVLAPLQAVALGGVAGHGRGADFAAERGDDSRRAYGQGAGLHPLAGRGAGEPVHMPRGRGGSLRRLRLAPDAQGADNSGHGVRNILAVLPSFSNKDSHRWKLCRGVSTFFARRGRCALCEPAAEGSARRACRNRTGVVKL